MVHLVERSPHTNLDFAIAVPTPSHMHKGLSFNWQLLASAWLHVVRNLEGSKNKQLFFRFPYDAGVHMACFSVALLAASRCSKIPASCRGEHVVDFGRLPVAFSGYGNLL